MTYRSRIADKELSDRLAYAGAVLIEGAKACGKTETAKQKARSHVYLDTDPQAIDALALDPGLVLQGDTPRLIDEWQVEASVWNHVRREVDERGAPGQFILTGSSVPADDATRHTGAGRFARLRMRPMTLSEAGWSSDEVSLTSLFQGRPSSAQDDGLSLEQLVERIVVGGWPAAQGLSIRAARESARDYLDQTARLDVRRVDGVRHDPTRVTAVLASLARHTASEAAISTIAADAGGNDGPLAESTVVNYLSALSRIFVVEDQPAWAPHLRSRSILRSAPKRQLVDPSLAVAALKAGPTQLISDLNLLGLLFESLVIRDLRVYAQALSGEVFHYRDNTGLEVDAIVQTADQGWGAIEVKLSPARVDAAAAGLLRFADRIDTGKMGKPKFLAVVTGKGYGFRRSDGVDVVPVAALGL